MNLNYITTNLGKYASVETFCQEYGIIVKHQYIDIDELEVSEV